MDLPVEVFWKIFSSINLKRCTKDVTNVYIQYFNSKLCHIIKASIFVIFDNSILARWLHLPINCLPCYNSHFLLSSCKDKFQVRQCNKIEKMASVVARPSFLLKLNNSAVQVAATRAGFVLIFNVIKLIIRSPVEGHDKVLGSNMSLILGILIIN